MDPSLTPPLLLRSGVREVDGVGGHDYSEQVAIVELPSQTAGHDHYKRDTAICISLHVALVLLHAALFGIYSHHYEHNITMPPALSTTMAPVVVGTVQQIFGTVYTAILVLFTQRLALRRDLNTRQTLTAVHDKTAAWLGIGSALSSLWDQEKLPAAVGGVFCITTYLSCIFALHISIQGLFHVVPYNATIQTVQPTLLANTNYTASSVSSYDILLMLGQTPTVGLLDSMVYDVIRSSPPGATGNATVNASVYDVQCVAFPELSLSAPPGSPAILSGNATDYLTLNVSTPYDDAVYAALYDESQWCLTGSPPECWGPIVIASTVAIVDSSGVEAVRSGGAWIPMEVQFANVISGTLITALQVVACSVGIDDLLINVSSTTLMPFAPPQRPAEVLWRNFSWPDNRFLDDPRKYVAINAPLLSPDSTHADSILLTALPVQNMSSPGTVGPSIPGTGIFGNSKTVDEIESKGASVDVSPKAFDVFIAEDLGIFSQNRTSISLVDLQHSLGKALAALHWYGRNQNYSNVHTDSDVVDGTHPAVPPQSDLAAGTGGAIISVLTLRYRLNLTLAPVLAGFIASTALLLLAVTLVRAPSLPQGHTAQATTTSAGVLQITWLLGRDPHLADVAFPETQALRAAGMFEVQMSDRARNEERMAFGSVNVRRGEEKSGSKDDVTLVEGDAATPLL